MTVTATAIPHLRDNYAWLLRDTDGTVGLCDPGEAAPCIAAIEAAGGRLDWIILTHHHGDHIDGVEGVRARFGAKVAGALADAHRLPELDLALRPGDTFILGSSGAEVIDAPGHTHGHVVYNFTQSHILLAGDVLFSLGCGRPSEGTAEELFHSIQPLKILPDDTLICCGHEYTADNARFCLSIEPENPDLIARAAEVQALRAAGQPTVPTTLGEERKANVFLRARDAATFAQYRAAKNSFR